MDCVGGENGRIGVFNWFLRRKLRADMRKIHVPRVAAATTAAVAAAMPGTHAASDPNMHTKNSETRSLVSYSKQLVLLFHCSSRRRNHFCTGAAYVTHEKVDFKFSEPIILFVQKLRRKLIASKNFCKKRVVKYQREILFRIFFIF